MKALASLVRLYFVGTPLARWLTALSVLVLVLSFGVLVMLALAVSSRSNDLHALYELNAYAAWAILAIAVGVGALFLATTLMPTMLARHFGGRQMSVLPNGGYKLLASAVITVAIVALPTACALPLILLSITGTKIDVGNLFLHAFTLGCLNLTLLYFAYWIASTRRTPGGRLGGAMVVIAIILGPTGGKHLLDPALSTLLAPAVALLSMWVLFAVSYLRADAVRALAARLWPMLSRGDRMNVLHGETDRLDMVLGTSRPWQLALIQVVPVLVATQFVRSSQAWLFFLTLIGAISGAFASTAAARSRVLWLRTAWLRADLFRRVERAFLRHNSYALGLLVVLLVAAGSYLDLSIRLLAYGLPLLILASAVSTYLGLMMTRPITGSEIVLTVFSMGLLMSAAVLAAQEERMSAVGLVTIEGLLAALTLACRYVAARRWQVLDWLECSRRSRLRLRES